MAVQRDKVIANAEKLVAKGKIEPAIKEYERLLEDNPNDVNTLNRIGDLWVRINNNNEAVKTFSKIADHYAKDGFFLKAIAIYKKINKLDPSKLEIYAKLADLYAKQGLAMEAKSQYQVLADYYLKHGDPANALNIYKKISELDPNSINVHVKLADLHHQVGHTQEALKEYDRVGRMLLKRGMLDEAVQVFKKALKIDARNVELVESLVTALIEAKDHENAKLIVEQALQANKDNPRLLALWGKILAAKGDPGSARSALEQALKSDPNDAAAREALADMYLKQNDASRALEMLIPLSEKALSRGERAAAVEMLHRVVRVDQSHIPTLERLVATYTRLNEETNILSSMNSLAEAHIAKRNYEQAAGVLEKLIQREPQNSQHRTKLQFVRSHMGGAEPAPPPRPKPVPEIPVAMEVEEPVPTFDEAPAMEIDSGGGMDLDFSEEKPAISISAETELPSMEIETEESDDLDFITEHLTEAEVFAKYGLAEKATEHLRAIIDRAPKHLPAHDRLFRILLDEGDIDAARTAANQYVALLQEQSDTATIDAVKHEFVLRGHALAPAAARPAPKKPPTVEKPLLELEQEVEELPAAAEVESEGLLAGGLGQAEEEISFEVDTGAGAPLEVEEAPPAAEELEEISFGEPQELTLEEEATEPAGEPFYGVEALQETPPEEEPLLEDEPLLQEEPLLAEEPVAEELVLEEPIVEEEPLIEELTPEEIAQVDFYLEQELYEEALEEVNRLSARFPGHPELVTRQEKAEKAIAAAAAPPPPPPPPKPAAPPKAAPAPPKAAPAPPKAAAPPPKPAAAPPKPAAPPPKPSGPPPQPPKPVVSRDEFESELLSALPDEDIGIIAPAPPPPAAPPPPPLQPAVTASPVQEENLFADEDNFFDLAAELESELGAADEEVVSLSEEEQSLEEIFKEFKKGVEQQLDSEDYDTHYNLGIAYKEMGLIDEAIGEFQLASKDPKRAVECASMLGLCFLEKGMPQLAIKWYRKGLEMPEIKEEEHIGLLYDLGSAYVEVGDTDNAQKAFMEVYGINSGYRDIVSRIKQLEDARK
jgi:tetratricopeptide (TPR) repeat protein